MDLFDTLTLIGGLAMFLFGMSLMGTALEKRAGTRLRAILAGLTSNKFKAFLLGLGVTAIIQSSSATTVMVVGFVNSGIMTLRQAVGVIMGANLGTSVTSWILSLTGIQGESALIQLLKPSSFTPILALFGVILYMFQKNAKKKDTGLILLGFAVLMFGMETMSGAVSGLRDDPNFTKLLVMFSNPFLGVLVGTVFTAVIQSSSASVGILQALTATGSVPYATAIPIIMGQNIGTCISALISSVGATKNAKRAAMIHFYFNVIATLILLPIYYLIEHTIGFAFDNYAATPLGIAVVHTVFKVLALAILTPCTGLLERLASMTVKESKGSDEMPVLDDRLLATPSIAIARSRRITEEMADISVSAMKLAMEQFASYDEKQSETVRKLEAKADKYEDILGTYLVKLSSHSMSQVDSVETSKLLHMIGDLERISDHAVELLSAAEEINDKKLAFSPDAVKEQQVIMGAVSDIMDLMLRSLKGDREASALVEPLDQVIDDLQLMVRDKHIDRLQKSMCTIEMGFILSDMLTSLERVADHCSNVAGCMVEIDHNSLDIHDYTHSLKTDSEDFSQNYKKFKRQYAI